LNNHILYIPALIVLAGLAAYLFIQLRRAKERYRRLSDRYSAMSAESNRTNLAQVEAKLNPHLFKNVLNSIQSHAYQTYYALDKVSNVLDYVLYDSRELVTPSDEIEFAKNLIEINKIKVSPLFQLVVRFKIDKDDPMLHEKILAPLSTIDLIENAFKHADLQNSEAFIHITFELSKGIFGLHVANKVSNREKLSKARGGVGSQTFEQRLNLIYNDRYTLQRFKEGETYVAYLKINLNEHKTKVYNS
jgi:LytS/YehU family sensor histidine kinase